MITIDDGHKNLYEKTIPIIEKYNVKATAFIISSKYSSNQFTKNKSDKVNFQSHTHNVYRGGCNGGHDVLFRCINYDKTLKYLQQAIIFLNSSDAITYLYSGCTDNV